MKLIINLLKKLNFNKPESKIIVNDSEINLEYFTQFLLINIGKIQGLFKISILLSLFSLFIISPKYSSSFIVINSPDGDSPSLANSSLISQLAGGSSGASINLSSVINTNDFLDTIIF